MPGSKLQLKEKLKVAEQLNKLGVDMIEVGFPAASEGDFNAVKEVASQFGKNDDLFIAALTRTVKADIDSVYHRIKLAERPLIHIVLGTSDRHTFSKKIPQIKSANVKY